MQKIPLIDFFLPKKYVEGAILASTFQSVGSSGSYTTGVLVKNLPE
jgi:hypothetical protein